MSVWLVMSTCGDYYCGCPGGSAKVAGHIHSVWLDKQKAEIEAAVLDAVPAQDTWVEEWKVSA